MSSVKSMGRPDLVTRRVRGQVMPLDLTLNQDATARHYGPLLIPPASASASIPTRTHGRLSPAAVASIKTKVRAYSTDSNAAYIRSPAFLSFLNEKSSRNQSEETLPSASSSENEKKSRKDLKIPVHVNVMKKGSSIIPQGIPRSPTLEPFSFEMSVENYCLTMDSSIDSPTLVFTIDISRDGTAEIIPLSGIPQSTHTNNIEVEIEQHTHGHVTPERSQTMPLPLKRTGSQRQNVNRSGGWFVKSPETGSFVAIDT